MKYMVQWTIPPTSYKAALEEFLRAGAPMPEGLTAIGRWHAPGSTYGWLLVETDNPATLAVHMAEWAALLELKITPVIEDGQAAEAAAKVYKP